MKLLSAPLTRPDWAKPLGPAANATVTFRMSLSEAEKYGLGDRWRKAMRKRTERQSRRDIFRERMAELVRRILWHGEACGLSQRELARKAGLSWGSFRRLRSGTVNPRDWLPKLEAAAARLRA